MRWQYFMLRYLDESEPNYLRILNFFGEVNLPYPQMFGVYCINVKIKLIKKLYSCMQYNEALSHAKQLIAYYDDLDTSVLYLICNYASVIKIFEQEIKEVQYGNKLLYTKRTDQFIYEHVNKSCLELLERNIDLLVDFFADEVLTDMKNYLVY